VIGNLGVRADIAVLNNHTVARDRDPGLSEVINGESNDRAAIGASSEFQADRAAAGKRYIRALERLKQILGQCPGGLDEMRP